MSEYDINERIEKLGPWWEKIYLEKDHIYTPGARSKKVLMENLDTHTDILKNIKDKRILDIGCNAGGLMLELSKRGAIVTAIDINDTFINQAQFIKEYYQLDNCKVIKYNICNYSLHENLSNLGYFDIICYFGLIYHLNYEKNRSILEYIYNATDIALSSSQITPYHLRNLDWDLSVENIDKLVLSVGYKNIEKLILDEKKIGELTNAYYFIMHK